MTETEAIQLFKDSRSVFTKMNQHGIIKIDDYLDEMEEINLDCLGLLWRSGYSGEQLSQMAGQAGLNEQDLKPLSQYLWFRNVEINRDTVENMRLAAGLIAGSIVFIILLVFCWQLGLFSGRRDGAFAEIAGTISFAIGSVAGWALSAPLDAWYRAGRAPSWPRGLYPLDSLES